MKRILVTGASGFLGSATLPKLTDVAGEVHAVSRSGNGKPELATWHSVDLMDRKAVLEVLSVVKPTHLLHLAWCTTPRMYLTSPENEQWLDSSKELIEAFAAQGGQHVVIAGTCMEYDVTAGVCTENVTPLAPSTLYGRTKLTLHDWIRSNQRDLGLELAWARIFHLYGPGEHPSRFVAFVVRSLLEGRKAEISEGTQRRDYLHVADAGTALRALVASDVDTTVNVGSGTAIAIKDLAMRIGDALGRPELIRIGSVPMAPTDVPLVQADIQRLEATIGGWQTTPLEDGLRDVIGYWSKSAAT